MPLDVGLRREIQLTAIGLRFTCKSGFQILFGLASFERGHTCCSFVKTGFTRVAGQHGDCDVGPAANNFDDCEFGPAADLTLTQGGKSSKRYFTHAGMSFAAKARVRY